jgi:hypothetical protein
MVDGRVVERPHGGHRSLNSNSGLVGGLWINWRSGRACRWKGETIGWEGWRVVCKKPAPCSPPPAPPVSVKDRWVDPREQVLNVPIACRCYGPGKPSSWLSTEACLFPTTSLAVVGEKLGTNL